MAFSSGTFTRLYSWVTDRNNTVKIRADRMDEEFDGIATALSTTICRDGQSTISANIPFNNKKITGLGDAAAATDALNRQSGDARYQRNANDLSAETGIDAADVLGFWDTSASANKGITYANLKTDLAAETAFIPATKITFAPASTIAATTVQAAVEEVNTEIQARTLTADGLVTGGGDLSANRTFTVTAATQSDQETGTSTATVVTPGRQHYHPSAAKAWWDVDQSSGTAAIVASYGVTSVTDGPTGNYDVNLTTAMSSINFSVTLGVLPNAAGGQAIVTQDEVATTTVITMRSANTSNTAVDLIGTCGAVLGDV